MERTRIRILKFAEVIIHLKNLKIMTSKRRAIVAYITIIGWCIAYFSKGKKDEFAKYHLRQALGIDITAIIFSIIASIVTAVIPFLGMILSIAGLIFIALMIYGIINANNDAVKPIPVVGKIFQDKFDFIK